MQNRIKSNANMILAKQCDMRYSTWSGLEALIVPCIFVFPHRLPSPSMIIGIPLKATYWYQNKEKLPFIIWGAKIVVIIIIEKVVYRLNIEIIPNYQSFHLIVYRMEPFTNYPFNFIEFNVHIIFYQLKMQQPCGVNAFYFATAARQPNHSTNITSKQEINISYASWNCSTSQTRAPYE